LDFSGFSLAEVAPLSLSLEVTSGLLSRGLDSLSVVLSEGFSSLLVEVETFLAATVVGLALATLEPCVTLLGQH